MSEREWGPVWVLRPSDPIGMRATLPSVLWSRTSLRWYAGAGISLIWLASAGTAIVHAAGSAASATLGIVLLVLYALAFLVSAPINWTLQTPRRVIAIAVVFGLSFLLWPWLGWSVSGIWTYVGVLIAAGVFPWRVTWPSILGLSLLALVFGVAHDGWTTDVLWVPAIIASISLMMAAFIRSIDSINRMRLAQREVERLAAERERGRVARDIHDILGHSLTVITVKSELAGRLVEADPVRAKAEMAEVEALARGALADVRATVAGFRGVSVSVELAAARVALAAAGVSLDAPSTTDGVAPEHRELAGWVVREGVTNVVRHAQAARCRIRLDTDRVSIEDDGIGPTGDGTGTGLSGLKERVDAAGGILAVGRSDLGGFRLEVTL